MAVTPFEIQQLYLAYFGRSSDVAGFAIYTTQPHWSVDAVAQAFSASPESLALYGPSFGAAQVDAIYRNLFGRAAEPEGVAYWTAAVDSGALSPAGAALAILQGAQNEDQACVLNKLRIAPMLGTVLHLLPSANGFYGADAGEMARNFLAHVDEDPQSVLFAQHYLGARFPRLQPGVIELDPPPPPPDGDFWHF